MEYLKEHKIKPKEIKGIEVIFTDGTNDVRANQITCEAYGYVWDQHSGTCKITTNSLSVQKAFRNADNTKFGKNNTVETGTNNSVLLGSSNKTKGKNTNVFITGEQNIISNGLNNTSIIGGKMGKALTQGQVLIGGGSYNSEPGLIQMSFVQLSNKTTDATLTSLTAQGVGTNYIELQNNSIVGYEAHIVALCSGGSSGTPGQYIYYKLIGAVKVDNGYNATFTQSISTSANGSLSISTTPVMATTTDPYMTIKVVGAANVNIGWAASVQLYENKLNSATF
jgi:hypothetical protein|tara:strand:+ start:181 stop:1023 length:843 start_codon:yes stop_codon:yes gene_type:complete